MWNKPTPELQVGICGKIYCQTFGTVGRKHGHHLLRLERKNLHGTCRGLNVGLKLTPHYGLPFSIGRPAEKGLAIGVIYRLLADKIGEYVGHNQSRFVNEWHKGSTIIDIYNSRRSQN